MESLPSAVIALIKSAPGVELSADEILALNAFPVGMVSRILLKLLRESEDATIESKAFSGLLHLEGYDVVGFLIGLFDEHSLPESVNNWRSLGWRTACCRRLAKCQDSRAITKLATIVLSDSDPDVRFVAAEALGDIGDQQALPALVYASQNDKGKDYEGFLVSAAADEAIAKIQARTT